VIPVLQVIFAAIDFARVPFSPTSQMFAELSISTVMHLGDTRITKVSS
jgi:hypothetical protein